MNVFRKENRRRILFTLTMTLLTAALAFGFASRVVEYLAIRQELERISEHYRPIGWLTSSDEIVDAGAELISESPFVETADAREFLWGTLTDLYNADLKGKIEGYLWDIYGVNNSEVLFWGVLKGVDEDWQDKERLTDRDMTDATRLVFTVSERISGYPDYAAEDKDISLVFTDEMAENGAWQLPELTVGKRYLVRAYYSGDRYGRWNGYEYWAETKQQYALFAMPVQDNRLFMTEAEGNEVLPVLLADKQMQLDELNRHSMMVIATKDMSAMPAAQDSQTRMFLTEGRWLDRNDDRTGAAVCAVHKDFAEARGLQVGDTVELTFRPVQMQLYAYAIGEKDLMNWQDYEAETKTYTVAGIYDYMPLNILIHNSSEENLEFYVPYGSVPEAYIQSRRTYSQNFSFVLKSPQDVDAFINEVQGPLAAMGMRIQLLENNWEHFAISANAMEQTSRAGVLVSIGVLFLGLTLIAFLYGRQNRKSFGIARALGVPRGKCLRMCLSPMLLMSVIGAGAGALLSWNYALGEAEKLLTGMQEHAEVGLSAWWLAGLIAAPVVLLSIEASIGFFVMARRPMLELIQDVSGGRRTTKNTETNIVKALEAVSPKSAGKVIVQDGSVLQKEEDADERQRQEEWMARSFLPPKAGKGGATASACRFILLHVRRRPVHTTLVVVEALAFFAAVAWMQTALVRDTAEVERLYETTEIDGELVKKDFTYAGSGGAYLTQNMIDWLAESGYLCDLYTEVADAVAVDCNIINSKADKTESNLVGISNEASMRSPEDIERFCAENHVAIDYADGYRAELFEKKWSTWSSIANRLQIQYNTPVIVPEIWLEQYDLEYGQELWITTDTGYTYTGFMIAGSIRSVDMGDGINRGTWDNILIPVSAWEVCKENKDWLYSAVRFTIDPAFNRELDTVEEEIARQLKSPWMARQDADVMLWSSELRQVVEPFEKNLELMKLLFPVTTAVSVIAGGGLIFLLLLQRTEEAALLRVLGNSRGRTRRMLLAEPVLLSLAGLLIGICVAYYGFPEIPAAQIGMFAGAYLGGCILGAILGVVHITRKMPLEQLQVKE